MVKYVCVTRYERYITLYLITIDVPSVCMLFPIFPSVDACMCVCARFLCCCASCLCLCLCVCVFAYVHSNFIIIFSPALLCVMFEYIVVLLSSCSILSWLSVSFLTWLPDFGSCLSHTNYDLLALIFESSCLSLSLSCMLGNRISIC